MIPKRIFQNFLPPSNTTSYKFIIFKLWNLSILLPFIEYDADDQIFKYKKSNLRIILSYLFFLFRIVIVWWASLLEINIIDRTINTGLSAVSFCAALTIIIIYEKMNHLELVQRGMKKLEECYKVCQNGNVQNNCLVALYLVLSFLLSLIDIYTNTTVSLFRVINSATSLLDIFVVANVFFLYACIINDLRSLFQIRYSPQQDFYLQYQREMNKTCKLFEIIRNFTENFSSIILLGFTVDFAFLIGSSYWITYSICFHTFYQSVIACLCFLWWINSAYRVFCVTMATADTKKEVSSEEFFLSDF